jgi:hypothetical protein
MAQEAQALFGLIIPLPEAYAKDNGMNLGFRDSDASRFGDPFYF